MNSLFGELDVDDDRLETEAMDGHDRNQTTTLDSLANNTFYGVSRAFNFYNSSSSVPFHESTISDYAYASIQPPPRVFLVTSPTFEFDRFRHFQLKSTLNVSQLPLSQFAEREATHFNVIVIVWGRRRKSPCSVLPS